MRLLPGRVAIRFRTSTIAGPAFVAALALCAGAAGAAAAPGDAVSAAVWPVEPHPVVAGFDPPDCQYCAGHRGVDLGALPLRPVRSALAGTVTYAGNLAGRGVVVVDDGSRRMTYEPVAATVRTRAVLSAGDLIGALELAGSHCYPEACLHVGLIDDRTDDYLDPMSLFGTDSEVRLLPLWTEQSIQSDLNLARLL